jgi:succinate dehydrogenase/fumarate reductase flavoprotein subunit
MKKFNSASDMARDMRISADALRTTFDKYNTAASSNKDEYGRKYFDNSHMEMNDTFHVAVVCPVVHYTMGGLFINHEASVLTPEGKVVPGLYAAGEVAGGVHGINRLGGSGLLGCVVYGRVAGKSAATYGARRGGASGGVQAVISQSGLSTRVTVNPATKQLTIDISWADEKNAPVTSSSSTASTAAAPPAASKPAAAPAAQRAMKQYSMEEVAKHNKESDCWVVVNGQVLDVTKFLSVHPGGKQAILLFAGKDATTEFNLIHKKDVVEKYAPDSIIGTLKGSSKL